MLAPVVVDDAHPFDLEAYIAGYSGMTAIYRLLHILERCPTLANATFQLAIQRIKAGRDVAFYRALVNLYNVVLPEGADFIEVDDAWSEAVMAANTNERNKLEVELKTYQSNMIKESIRMAHRDLGNFYRAIGDDGIALKHYTKSREFCTASQHVLDMCLSVLELIIEQRNYSHISTYVFKADAALDVATSTANTGPGGSVPSAQLHKKTAPSAEREKVQTKLDVAMALAHLGQASYEKAAVTFLKLGPPKGLEDWDGKIISPSDIAIYGTLCALATLSRGAIKAQLLQNEVFTIYLEQEPYVRELVTAYMSSKFKIVLELLEKYSARHDLDVHLAAHIHDLRNLIRDRALVLYFQPFATVKLQKMAAAFGLEVKEIEMLVVGLIQSGNIKGRVDSRNKILKANVVDQRATLFSRAAQAGAQIQATNRKLLLRMRLQQADLVVKAPKTQRQMIEHPIAMTIENAIEV
ncbi:26S proteasome subunit RPN7-domain-containing protein [Phellopilus nigrolimitatus]|nr:26S proteasome subunit RPN7-domain-containing protein [Phellopilus nigrolimitatus]